MYVISFIAATNENTRVKLSYVKLFYMDLGSFTNVDSSCCEGTKNSYLLVLESLFIYFPFIQFYVTP